MQLKRGITVIICAYTEDRWSELVAVLESIQRQSLQAQDIILVVDHNTKLFQFALEKFVGIKVIENTNERGLSGSRNTGIQASNTEILAFIDDDAIANHTWLEALYEEYQNPDVMGVGGSILPTWSSERPKWFPEEFYWVVGCTYRGLPEEKRRIRNLIGCNMSFRNDVFSTIGGFREGVGRIDVLPYGCEETELCIRARQEWPEKEFIYKPAASVTHRVSEQRTRFSYFVSRCYSEGISKARVTDFVGSKDGLSSERSYVLRTLTKGIWNNIYDAISRYEPSLLLRAGSILIGLMITTIGYLKGKIDKEKWSDNKARILDKTDLKRNREAIDFSPIGILPIEISEALPSLPAYDETIPGSYRKIQALIRLHNQPLGILELDVTSSEINAEDLSDLIQFSFINQIQDHLIHDGISVSDFFHGRDIRNPYTQQCKFAPYLKLDNEPHITIVVATRDRLDLLKRCLESIFKLDYSNFDVVIVDNAPGSNDVRDFIQNTYGQNNKLRYVREDNPGLAIAHNRAFAEVTAPIVAFTDDDVVVDPHWLRAIAHHFLQDDEIGCVTGLILPAELETVSQLWVEQFGGFGKGFTEKIFDLGEHRPKDFLFPYTAGKLGSGANMAFRTTALRAIGGFNPALGAGTLSMGGDDLAAFFDIITHGFKLVYEPAALVFHTHPKAYSNLKQQSYGYGVGLGAFLMRTLIDKPTRLGELILKSPFGLIYFLSPNSLQKVNGKNKVPRELRFRQFIGLLYGPVAYLRSFIRTRRMRERLYRFQKSWSLDSKSF